MIALLFLLIPAFCLAEIHYVTPSESIQAAIDSASVGDTLILSDGEYAETFWPHGVDLVIASGFLLDGDTSHVSNTILEPDSLHSDTGSVCIYGSGETLASRIVGLRFRRGTGTWVDLPGFNPGFAGGAILIYHAASLSIENCIIEWSSATAMLYRGAEVC